MSEAVYWLVFLLFLPAILGALHLDGLLRPVQSMIDKVLAFLPNLLAAVLILAVGWLLARVIQRVVSNLLAAVGSRSAGGEHRSGKGPRRAEALRAHRVAALCLHPDSRAGGRSQHPAPRRNHGARERDAADAPGGPAAALRRHPRARHRLLRRSDRVRAGRQRARRSSDSTASSSVSGWETSPRRASRPRRRSSGTWCLSR